MRLIAILTILSFTTYGQSKSQGLQTKKYSGTYSNTTGTILIYPESDTTSLFYIDINKGAPSYNMGSLYGRLKINKGQGIYESKDQGCQWTIQFSKDKLTIKTIKEFYDCGFGNGVIADGVFTQTSKKVPDSFVNLEGIKYYFTQTTPEKYNE